LIPPLHSRDFIVELLLILVFAPLSIDLLCVPSMRVLPHHQDSGGFFIAVLQKRDWLPWQRQHKLSKNPTDRTGDTTAETEAISTEMTSNTTSGDTSKSFQDTATLIQDTICISQQTVHSGMEDSKPIVSMETVSGVEKTASVVQSATEGTSTQLTPAATEHGEEVTVGDTAEERPPTSILGRYVMSQFELNILPIFSLVFHLHYQAWLPAATQPGVQGRPLCLSRK